MRKEDLWKIMDKEELFDWEIKKSESGWMILPESKKIVLKNYNDFSLFLHEIAHAKTEKKIKNKKFHNVIWADEYTRLVYKYTTPRKNL